MTVIFIGEQFWIESFNSARTSVADAAIKDDTFFLERQGIFLGGSAVLDSDSVDTEEPTILRSTGSGELVFGVVIAGVRVLTRNESGFARNMGHHAIVFLRKP